LSISALALMEVWARSAREDELEFLQSRARNLAEYIDPLDPIVPTGAELIARLGGRIAGDEFRQPDVSFEVGIREVWRLLTAGTYPREVLRQSGFAANAEIDDLAKGWVRTSRNLDPALGPKIAAHAESEAVKPVAAWFANSWGRDISLRYGIQERLHGYFRIVALHAVRAAARTHGATTENDSEDVQLLMHLADDVMLVTSDFGLIERADDTGSFQAPYVRTIGELLTQSAPEGPPWGRSARRALKSHSKRERRGLHDLDQASRAK